jgi:DNA-binding transcriptional ArsR family regulator
MTSTLPTPQLLELAAERLKALAEPNRLLLVHALREGERTVTELVDLSGMAQASVSRHLGVLHGAGLVSRRRDGSWVFYSVSDGEVGELCDMVCSRVARTRG